MPSYADPDPRRRATVFLAALAFFLSVVEYMIPKPLPFMRLGIANLPLLVAVDLLPAPWYYTLAALKVCGMSLLSGTLLSYVALFSLAGTLAAAAAMRALRPALRSGLAGYAGVSVAGAMASNAAQLLLARLFVFGAATRYIAPAFLLTGLVTGIALGAFAARFVPRSRWFARVREDIHGL